MAFDFLIVIGSIISLAIQFIIGNDAGYIINMARILRIFRLLGFRKSQSGRERMKSERE